MTRVIAYSSMMARGTDIEQFPAKLKQAMDRANMSRAQLAQAVGADKSVIARWLSGGINPADHSLSAISVVLAGHIAGFSRADWELPVTEFAVRLGITAPAASVGLLADANAWAAPGLATAISDYAGLWDIIHLSVSDGKHVNHMALDLYAAPSGLAFDRGVGGWMRSTGTALVIDQLVYILAAGEVPRRRINVFILLGVMAGHGAMLLDGMMMGRAATMVGPIIATRAILVRIAGPLPDGDIRRQRFERAAAMADVLVAQKPAAPAGLVSALQNEVSEETGGAVLRVASHRAWTRSAREMASLGTASPQAEASDWARGLFAAAMADPAG